MSLIKRLFGKKSTAKNVTAEDKYGKYLPKKEMPVDERFTYNFNKNGGKFLYCVDTEEIMQAFDNILIENNWYEKEVCCFNPQLEKKFEGFNLKFKTSPKAPFFISTCEALVGKNGSILLSSNQLKEKKLNELPSNFIIYATTSQFVENISEGLRIIKNNCKKNIPTNITTIQDFETQKEKDFMNYGSSTKNLYLLLLEDL